jgi:hypothetical protein
MGKATFISTAMKKPAAEKACEGDAKRTVLATWEIRSKNQNVYAKIGGVKKL